MINCDFQTKDKLLTAAALGSGWTAYIGTSKALSYTVNNIIKKSTKNINTNHFNEIKISAKKMIDDFESQDTPINLIDASRKDFAIKDNKEYETYKKQLSNSKNPFKRFLKKTILKNFEKKLKSWKNGTNAVAFSTIPQTIIINMEKFPQAIFHEAGHCVDFRSLAYKSLKNLQIPPNIILPAIIIPTLVYPFKQNDKTPQNPLISVWKFINKHYAALIGILSFPLLRNEFMANVHGQKLAKHYIKSKSALKTITKNNILSFTSYIVIPAISITSGSIGNSVKNKLLKYRNTKNKN